MLDKYFLKKRNMPETNYYDYYKTLEGPHINEWNLMNLISRIMFTLINYVSENISDIPSKSIKDKAKPYHHMWPLSVCQ